MPNKSSLIVVLLVVVLKLLKFITNKLKRLENILPGIWARLKIIFKIEYETSYDARKSGIKENNCMVRHNSEVTLQIGMLNSDSSA